MSDHDDLAWLDEMINDHYGQSSDGGGFEENGEWRSPFDTPDSRVNLTGRENWEDAADAAMGGGVVDFLVGISRDKRKREAQAKVDRHEYRTKDTIEQFAKKFHKRPQRADGHVAEVDGVRFVKHGFVHTSVVGTCPKCGRPTESDPVKHYHEFGDLIENFRPHREHRCDDPRSDREAYENATKELRPVPPPEPPKPQPRRETIHTDSFYSFNHPAEAERVEQPRPETEQEAQRRARQVQAQRQPGERAVGHRRQRPQQQEGGSIWGVLILIIGFAAIGGLLLYGAIHLRGRVAAVVTDQPAVQQQLVAPTAIAPAQVELQWNEVEPGKVWETTAMAPFGMWKMKVEVHPSIVALSMGPESSPYAPMPSEVFATVEGAMRRAEELAATWQQQ